MSNVPDSPILLRLLQNAAAGNVFHYGLIIHAESPQRQNIEVSAFNVIFDDKGIIYILNLLLFL